jgi:hypothetical protein
MVGVGQHGRVEHDGGHVFASTAEARATFREFLGSCRVR